MENSWSWVQRELINEIIQGMETAKQLRLHLNGTSSFQTMDLLVQRILSSYEKALLLLNLNGSIGGTSTSVGLAKSAIESPSSRNESPRSDELDGVGKDDQSPCDASKNRKAMPKWKEQVRVNPESGMEGPLADGFSWRKYGQKDILGAKYPRSYYRCTYRNNQSCWATKQVQKSDNDPTIFDIIYRGVHTCAQGNQCVAQPASSEKEEQKLNIINNYQNQQPQEALLNLRKGLKISTQDLDTRKQEFPVSFTSSYGYRMSERNYSPSFTSPATPESNVYSFSPILMNKYGGLQNLHQSDSDFTHIISAATSATNSQIVDLDFPMDPSEVDPNFPFDKPRFFS